MTDASGYALAGRIEEAVDAVDRLVSSGDQELQLDFSAVTLVSVEGLEWLEELLLRATSRRKPVRFVNVPPPVYKMFKVSHISSILNACGSPVIGGSVC